MNLLIFCVYDKKTEAFGQPFFVTTEGVALRSFLNCIGDPSHDFSKAPFDFSLFHIGEYSPDTGELSAVSPEEKMTGVTAHKIVKKYQHAEEHEELTEESKAYYFCNNYCEEDCEAADPDCKHLLKGRK